MTWQELAESEREKATQRVKESQMLLALALEAHAREKTRANEVAVKAAMRLVKEARCQEAEWNV